MRSKAKEPPSSSKTARSRSSSPTTMATKPSSKRNDRLLMSPASARSSSSSDEQPRLMIPSPKPVWRRVFNCFLDALGQRREVAKLGSDVGVRAASEPASAAFTDGVRRIADASASISRGDSVRWAARLASRSRSGNAARSSAKLLPRRPGAHQPVDGVVPRLDRLGVEQRLGQPAPQHPGAHRRPRHVDGRQQRAVALTAAQGSRSAPGCAGWPRPAPSSPRPRTAPAGPAGRARPAASPRRIPAAQPSRGPPAGARPGRGWRRSTVSNCWRRRSTARYGENDVSGRGVGRAPGGNRSSRSIGVPASTGRDQALGRSEPHQLGGQERSERPVHRTCGRRDLPGADVNPGQPGASTLDQDGGQEVVRADRQQPLFDQRAQA